MKFTQLYFFDPQRLEFEAEVTESLTLADGRPAVLLSESYFYPTGGGQEHDTGSLGPARVVDVLKDNERVLHILDRFLPPGPVRASIDRERRQRHMQHHSAQHLLTQCFLRLAELETLSANINGYTPATLDLAASALADGLLEQAEALANRVVLENRAIKSYFVSPAELARLPLRRAPSVQEDIRVVEIDSYDYTPCGGTHCLATGSIGPIKLLRTERPNAGRLRVHFAAGLQALDLFRAEHAAVSELNALFGTPLSELPGAVRRQTGQLRAAQDQVQELQAALLPLEAARLAAAPETLAGRPFILACFENRPPGDLRALAAELRTPGGPPALLAAWDGQKLSLLAVCPPGCGLNARDLLTAALTPLGGRGGGDAVLAQGGGPLDPPGFSTLADRLRTAAASLY